MEPSGEGGVEGTGPCAGRTARGGVAAAGGEGATGLDHAVERDFSPIRARTAGSAQCPGNRVHTAQQIKFLHGTNTKASWYEYQGRDPSGFKSLKESST